MTGNPRTSLAGFLGDAVVYRNLNPADPRLPTFRAVSSEVGLPVDRLPRKCQPEYGRVISRLLRAARALTAPHAAIERILYVGDTRLNDANALAAICEAGGWRGIGFIGEETTSPQRIQVEAFEPRHSALVLANRWALLAELEGLCRRRDFAIDERTAVIVDLDKTALGGRGRNDRVIDAARLDALERTLRDLLESRFDAAENRAFYDALNRPRFHPFTTDNQDVLAYLCLLVGARFVAGDALLSGIREGSIRDLADVLVRVDREEKRLPDSVRAAHRAFATAARRGDPTPFVAFRKNEYRATVARMGGRQGADVDERLREEIVITGEVRDAAMRWRAGGALLFGLSDKPDEASVPGDALARKGFLPIHRTETHVVHG